MAGGRPRTINNADELWALFEDYRKVTKGNPFKKHIFVGKDGAPEWQLIERPLTVTGFYAYCHNSVGDVSHYFEEPERFQEFRVTCKRIKEEIRSEQIAGGMAGIYNHSLTARLNGLVEKTETKGDIKQEIVVKFEDEANDNKTTEAP